MGRGSAGTDELRWRVTFISLTPRLLHGPCRVQLRADPNPEGRSMPLEVINALSHRAGGAQAIVVAHGAGGPRLGGGS
jgi:hypothetical protein